MAGLGAHAGAEQAGPRGRAGRGEEGGSALRGVGDTACSPGGHCLVWGGGAGRQPTTWGVWERQVTQIVSFCLGTDRRPTSDQLPRKPGLHAVSTSWLTATQFTTEAPRSLRSSHGGTAPQLR